MVVSEIIDRVQKLHNSDLNVYYNFLGILLINYSVPTQKLRCTICGIHNEEATREALRAQNGYFFI